MDNSPVATNGGTIRFPTFSPDFQQEDSPYGDDKKDTPPWNHDTQWTPRRYSGRSRWPGLANGTAISAYPGRSRHARQKSLSEAIRTIRTRSGSVSQNAMEIADALKAPVSYKVVGLFCLWYAASVGSSTTSKVVLNSFPKPVTLTIVQFIFVSFWCLALGSLAAVFRPLRQIAVFKNGIKRPSRSIITTTLPLTAFMIGGHILSSDAISRIPVSLVHTIKGLSPLFTVAAYRFIFHHRYSKYTYLSLVPLTIGVMLACSTDFSANFLGLLSAFLSAIVFVTQNIVSKKIFNEAAIAEADPRLTKKPDKLNLLCYSSLIALLFTAPIWLYSEGWNIIVDFYSDASITLSNKPDAYDHGRLAIEYFLNGICHFLQSLAAFILLSTVSPVTYSVASLVKRVFVVVFSITWFGNPVTGVQWLGITLTFLGLYLYDRTSEAKADRFRIKAGAQAVPLLPLVEKPFESPPAHHQSARPLFTGGLAQSPTDGDHQLSPLPSEKEGNGWLAAGHAGEEGWNAHQRDMRAEASS